MMGIRLKSRGFPSNDEPNRPQNLKIKKSLNLFNAWQEITKLLREKAITTLETLLLYDSTFESFKLRSKK